MADDDEDMEQQTLSSLTGQSQIEFLLGIAEPCNNCRRTGATCTPIAGNIMGCLNRRLNAMAVILEKVYPFMICQPRLKANIDAKIRECANSADYGPSPTSSHDSRSSPLEATHTPPRYSPEPRKMPTAALWNIRTGEQIHTPPGKSPVSKQKGPHGSETPTATLWDNKKAEQIYYLPRKPPVGKQKGPNPSETPTAALWDTQTGKQICSPPRYSPEPRKMPTAALWDTKTGKQIDSPPRYSPEPRKMPTAALWNTKTGEQIYSPPRKSPIGKQKEPNPSETPRAPITRDPPGPTLGTFWPSGKPTIRAQYPSNDYKLESAEKGNEPVIDTQDTNRKKSEDSQETEVIEGLIKDIQQPLEGSKLDTLEPDSKVSHDQAMVGSAHAAEKMALLNSPGKEKGHSTDQPGEPVRARRTTEELEAARNIGG